MKTLLTATVLLLFASLVVMIVPARAADTTSERSLVGSWRLIERSVDAQGQACPFVPDSIEFFSDKTLIMSNMPGNRLPFKTTVAADERTAVESRMPELTGKSLLLIKPVPQMEWRNTPMSYGYTLSAKKGILTLIVPGWSPAKFQRAQ